MQRRDFEHFTHSIESLFKSVVASTAMHDYRVSIAKDGKVFWSSQWVSAARAEIIRRKNQKLVDAHQWRHVVTIEERAT